MNPNHKLASSVAILGFLADGVTTFFGLGSIGLVETNPLMRQTIASYGTAGGIVLLSIVSFLIIYITADLGRRSGIPGTETGATLGLYSVGILKLGFASWNSLLILSV